MVCLEFHSDFFLQLHLLKIKTYRAILYVVYKSKFIPFKYVDFCADSLGFSIPIWLTLSCCSGYLCNTIGISICLPHRIIQWITDMLSKNIKYVLILWYLISALWLVLHVMIFETLQVLILLNHPLKSVYCHALWYVSSCLYGVNF